MLPTEKKDRKERPVYSGVLAYFPDALAEVAYVSYIGNRQHNGADAPMHWAREKSTDHEDCIVRHLLERGTLDDDGLRHSAKVAWRALAMLQVELEAVPTQEQENERIKKILDDVFSDPDTPIFRSGTFTPLMYANTHTDAREPAYAPPRGFVPLSHCTGSSDAREPASPGNADALDKAMQAETPLNLEELEDIDWDAVEAQVEADMKDRPTYYISGPMRGLKDFNFPAFDAARDRLKAHDINVISPADMDRELDEGDEQPSFVYVDRDVHALIQLAKDNPTGQNAIYMLKGWVRSKGATAEYFVADWLGLKIIDEGSTYDPTLDDEGREIK